MVPHTELIWKCRDRVLNFKNRPLVMGILNVTPDSFSDGGLWQDMNSAIVRAGQLLTDGADILDVGGESTRPGAESVSAEEELRRVLPVVSELASNTPAIISVDTSKAIVARRCLEAGAHIINDVCGLRGDPDMPAVVRDFSAGVVIMHMQGTPQTMQLNPAYDDVVLDVNQFFAERMASLTDAGVDPDSISIDPGIGFGKTHEHTLRQLAGLGEVSRFGRPVCLGVSRKGFLGIITGRSRQERMAASLSVACYAIATGSAHVVRVHDVAPTRDAVLIWQAIQAAGSLS